MGFAVLILLIMHAHAVTRFQIRRCEAAWAQDALEEAEDGDTNYMLLYAQMLYAGYGVAEDLDECERWLRRCMESPDDDFGSAAAARRFLDRVAAKRQKRAEQRVKA
jgi:lipopolysaccharide biosynthesis regulator YciM